MLSKSLLKRESENLQPDKKKITMWFQWSIFRNVCLLFLKPWQSLKYVAVLCQSICIIFKAYNPAAAILSLSVASLLLVPYEREMAFFLISLFPNKNCA
jgi:hypothetical protein